MSETRMVGSSAHAKEERQVHDYYATHPSAAEHLLSLDSFKKDIWEPACGEGHLSKVFQAAGHNVKSTDLIDRGYGTGGIDFLAIDNLEWNGDIITNPPFTLAKEFIEKSLQIVPEGSKVAMFLRVQIMEGMARKQLFTQYPPITVYVSSSRIPCAKNGDFEALKKTGSAVAYGWFVWQKGFKGDTILKWFN